MGLLRRAITSRIALVLFGVCVSLITCEVALRIGSLFVGRDLVQASARTGKWRVLSLGDSNTYGVYLDGTQAYPQVFERQWNAQHEDASGAVEVFNLGYPGMNSSRVLKDFERLIRAFQPDVVTVMVGANDVWTVPETAAESASLMERLVSLCWKRSKVCQLLYMMRRSMENRQLEITAPPKRLGGITTARASAPGSRAADSRGA